MPWVDAFRLDKLPVGSARAWRHGDNQVAFFHVAEGVVHAVANRCPHEGYPLIQGYVRDGTLTCAWHNFKFDLKSGACLVGDDPVQVYPVRFEEGRVVVALTPIDEDAARLTAAANLADAVVDRRIGQAVRELVRLQRLGADNAELAAQLLRIDARHGRYGTTHGSAVVLEGLQRAAGQSGKPAILCLIPGLVMVSESVARLPSRERAEPIAINDRNDWRSDFAAAVESEDLARAEGLLRGALAARQYDAALAVLATAVADHFLSFGHPLIYHLKLRAFLFENGFADADALLGAHLAGIVYGTRHDTLPPWKSWRRRVAGRAAPAPSAARSTKGMDGVAEAVVHGDEKTFFASLAEAVDRDVVAAASGLLLGACTLMRRFNTDLDDDPNCQDDWLNITHGLTSAVAVCQFIEASYPPEACRKLLFHLGRFLHGMQPLLSPIAAPPPSAAWAERAEALRAASFDDPSGRPIVTAHLIKTTSAALWAAEHLQGEAAMAARAAIEHLHAHPPRPFHAARLLEDAWVNIIDGSVPTSLMR